MNASEIIGLKVRDKQNDDLGKISDGLLIANGRATSVILDVEGVLGIGSHPVRIGRKDIQLYDDGGDRFSAVSISLPPQ